VRATHLQLHTLYGAGQPDSFMFLGQILMSVRNNLPFKMTSGRQMREYHHLADEVRAIRQIAGSARTGVMDVSHGHPLRLRMIAEEVFQAFAKSELLRVGALPEPPEENYEKIFKRSEFLQQISFRDSLPSIVQYMRELCAAA
jgi:nucleoside-diphosphate-sugar epimerase